MNMPVPIAVPQDSVPKSRFEEEGFDWEKYIRSVSINSCVYAQVKADYTKMNDTYFVCMPTEVLKDLKTIDKKHCAQSALARVDFKEQVGLNGPYDFTYAGTGDELKEFMDFFGATYSQELETIANDLFTEEQKHARVTQARDGGFISVSPLEIPVWNHLINVDMAVDEVGNTYDVDIEDRTATDPVFVFSGKNEKLTFDKDMFDTAKLVKKKKDRYHKFECKIKDKDGKKQKRLFRIYETPAPFRF